MKIHTKASRQFVCIIVFIVLIFSLDGCNWLFAAEQSTRNVKVGKTFFIELETNPSTGYQWNPVFDSEYFILESSVVEGRNERIVGAPTKVRFTFVPIKSGISVIVFNYTRSWEPGTVKTERFRFNVEN